MPRRRRLRTRWAGRTALDDGGANTEQINFVRQQLFAEKPNWNRMMVDKTPSQAYACPREELSPTSGGAGTPAPATCSRRSTRAVGPPALPHQIALLDKLSVEHTRAEAAGRRLPPPPRRRLARSSATTD